MNGIVGYVHTIGNPNLTMCTFQKTQEERFLSSRKHYPNNYDFDSTIKICLRQPTR